MHRRLQERTRHVWALLRGSLGPLFLCALMGVVGAGAGLAEDAKVPAGWTSETKQVKVATPNGEEVKTITYYTNSIGAPFVLIPAGEFVMGSPEGEQGRSGNESPQHKVRITKPFYIGAYEVSQKQYGAIVRRMQPRFHGENNPMEKVSWNEVELVCKELSQREGVTYRLPTEAEWEYACRAGATTPYSFGTTISDKQANYNVSGVMEDAIAPKGRPMPVGSFPPNAFGLYDMHGNVYEMCSDWYDGDYYAKSPAEDPKGPDGGLERVARGGAWSAPAAKARSAAREYAQTPARYGFLGFRLAVEVPK